MSIRTIGSSFSGLPVVIHPVIEGVGLPLDVIHLLPVVQPVLVALESGGQTEWDLERKTVNPAVTLLSPSKGFGKKGLSSQLGLYKYIFCSDTSRLSSIGIL